MNIAAVYSGCPDLGYFLKLEELAALYDKIYIEGDDFLSGVNMFADIDNIFFTADMEEVITQLTDVVFYQDCDGMDSKIQYFTERGKKVWHCDTSADSKEQDKKGANRLYDISCPVVSVMGISEKCERHKLFIDVLRALEQEGYHVMGISGEPISRMGAYVPIPQTVYEAARLTERTVAFNHFLYHSVKENRPDLVVIDVPGGIMNQSPLEYTCDGECALMIANAVDIDASLLAVPPHEINDEFVTQLTELCRQRFLSNVAGIAMSCVGSKTNIEEDRTDYYTLPVEFVKERYLKEDKYSVPVKPLHGSGKYFAEYLINMLSEAG